MIYHYFVYSGNFEADDAEIVRTTFESGNMFVRGGTADDVLAAGAYNDIIVGAQGNDTLNGYGGNDDIIGNAGNDKIYGGAGNDDLHGGYYHGNDEIYGGAGDDRIWTGDGTDLVDGGAGNDWILLSDGLKTIMGGSGDDMIVDKYTDFFDGSSVDGGGGTDHLYLDIKRENVEITQNGEKLLLKIGTSKTLEVTKVETIQFEDGVWDGVADIILAPDPDPDCPHTTGDFKLSGKWEYIDEPKDVCEITTSFSINHSKGDAVLRVGTAGIASHDDKSLSVSGGVFYAGPDQIRLFSGSLNGFSFSSGVGSVVDTANHVDDLRLGGLDLTFKNIAILKNSVRADVALKLPNELTGDDDQIEIDSEYVKGFTAIIDKSGAYLGSLVTTHFALPDVEFDYFGIVSAKATHQSLSYTALTDTFKMQGKYEFESFFKGVAIEKLELDLSGTNFIQISDGKVDMVGSLKYSEPIEWGVKGFGISHLQVDVNTVAGTFGGAVGVRLPFQMRSVELIGSLEFATVPEFQINSIGLKVDGLNMPVGTTPLFLKSINGKIANWSDADNVPTSLSGGAEFTAGPEYNDAAVATMSLQITADENQLIGDGTFQLIDTRIFFGTVNVTANWQKTPYLSVQGNFDLLDGFSTFVGEFKANRNFDFFIDTIGETAIPTFVFGIGGTKLSSANVRVSFSNDDDYSNDFVATWEEKQFTGLFTTAKYTIGAKYDFEGNFSVFGLDTIPQLQAQAKAFKAFGLEKAAAEAVETAPEWMFLSASWENTAVGNIVVQVIDPNGVEINELNFAAHKIEIVTDLTNSFNKTVIVGEPMAGDWRIEVVNGVGLGEIKYAAAKENEKPQLTFISPASVQNDPGQVNVEFNALDADSVAKLSLYYDDDATGFDGVLFKDGIEETDGNGNFIWDLDGLATGSYYIYGILADGVNPEDMAYAAGRIDVVTGGAGIVEGTNGSNHMQGTDGDDVLHGLGGYDIIEGYAGDDILRGGAADDRLIDTLGADLLEGEDGADELIALSGTNVLNGGADGDLLIGGYHSDILNGNEGDDLIRGDAGDVMGGSDVITGGAGDDLLMGGHGADIFKFNVADGQDIIGQFKIDQVDLSLTGGYSVAVSGKDFEVGIDHVELTNFSNVNANNVMDFISDIGSNAVFSAEGTDITFFGLLESQLSGSDFVFS